MCIKRLFQLSPVPYQKGQRIKTGKNKAGFSKLFKRNPQGKPCC